ncbi:hypothetical protein QWZ02_09375 [Kinneretia asaccharophila]|uniref:Uncharacterized protein n=1 Tax=Roseateles asaccharophilus TaxID=582607 RepID=A0A4R6N3T6_9BURK|nr:hypothetical protein [Roseateles asaccharophilus]MDN3544657.1 hypothetical protein [Roseateles asaccharophilus]TDP09576.1 hypothetical protein DFR39_104137 [Roseateles asaccharophilus]
MGAFWDSISGAGYDGTEDGGVGDVGANDSPQVIAARSDGSGGFWSGALQVATTLGTGYLAKRMDIDLYSRAQAAQPYPTLGSTQGPLFMGGAGVPRPGGVSLGQQRPPTLLNLNALMPFLLVGGVVWFVASKKG